MGILDFWNEQPPSPYTPEMRMNAGMQQLGLLGGSLMAAGAPSTNPGQFGQTMGQYAAQSGPMMQQSLQQQLQMSEWQKEQERQAAMQDYLAGGAGGLLSPEQLQFIQNAPPEVGMGLLGEQLFAQSSAEPYTLSPGEVRYGANNEVLATGPEEPVTTATIETLPDGRTVEVKRDQNGQVLDYTFAPVGSSTTVSLPPAEGEFQKAFGKFWGEQYGAMQGAAAAASGANASLDQMQQFLDAGATTGAGAETKLDLDKMALAISRTTGLDLGVDEASVGTGEAMRALGNKMALELRNPDSGAGMPGSMSDSDREFLTSSMPGLSMTPEGNRILIGLMRKINERKVQVARLADQYIQQNGTLNGGFNDYLAANLGSQPLVTPEERAATQAALAVSTIPSGSTIKYDAQGNRIQ